MSDSLLNLLKLLLLALVYLFFIRVLRAMWVQVTAPAAVSGATPGAADPTMRAGAPPVARLRIIEPADMKGKTFDLTDEVTVGRVSGCQVALSDPTVSQLHARIFRRDGRLYVEDLGSSNGTFVNRKKVAAPVAIRRGDRLAVRVDGARGDAMRLRWSAVTDVGMVRHNNQDQVLADEPLFAVADGMGGHAAGDVAAEVAVETLRASFAADPTAEGLVRAVQQADSVVWQRAQDNPDLRGMGTTTTAAALVKQDGEPIIEIADVGDSRGYLLRDGELDQLTDDHSLVEDLVRSGRLSPEDALNHPQRNIVTRALGMEDRDGEAVALEVDTVTVLPYKGDRILLASDGLTNELSDDEIASVLRRLADPDDAARELVRLAKAAGGNDNISVVLVDVVDDDDKAGDASRALAKEPAPPSGTGPDVEQEVEREPTRPTPAVAAAPAASRRPRARRTCPRVTLRAPAFVGAVAAVLVMGVIATTWYARGSYYVGLQGASQNITIFQGRPGGFLWVKPTVAQRFSLRADQVPPSRLSHLREGQPEPTLRAACHYVTNLQDEAAKLVPTTVPTTTVPSGPTTVAPAPQ